MDVTRLDVARGLLVTLLEHTKSNAAGFFTDMTTTDPPFVAHEPATVHTFVGSFDGFWCAVDRLSLRGRRTSTARSFFDAWGADHLETDKHSFLRAWRAAGGSNEREVAAILDAPSASGIFVAFFIMIADDTDDTDDIGTLLTYFTELTRVDDH